VARAQDQDRLVESVRSPLPEQIDPVAVGETEIEDDDIVRRFGERIERVLARVHPRDCVRALLEPALQKLAEPLLVFDDQDFHLGPMLAQIPLELAERKFRIATGSRQEVSLVSLLAGTGYAQCGCTRAMYL